MLTGKKYDINRLRDYSSLFSRTEVCRWYRSEWTSLRVKIDRHDPAILQKESTYLDYLKHVYSVLAKFYPNEYVYKNEFISKWLLQEIGVTGSVLFNEFKLGKAVADLAMFNGVSKVFEIKTLLDKEARLGNQLDQYGRLFNEIYIVVPEAKVHLYLKRDPAAGVIVYDDTKSSFSLERKANHREDIDTDVLMQVLHTHEYITIVEQHYGEKPVFHDFNKFQVCKELIRQIPRDELSKQFVSLMKQRKIHNSFSKREKQFNQLLLSMNYTPMQKQHLLSNLRTTIC